MTSSGSLIQASVDSNIITVSRLDANETPALEKASIVGYEAFRHFALSATHAPEFNSSDEYQGLLQFFLSLPQTFALKATIKNNLFAPGDYNVLGSVTMLCCDPIAAIGPISALPTTIAEDSGQYSGVGRVLLQGCLQYARDKDIKSVRLVQLTSNIRSYALYIKTGFNPQEFMVDIKGPLDSQLFMEYEKHEMPGHNRIVRQMTPSDLEACDSLHIETNGVSRMVSLKIFTSAPVATEALQPTRGKLRSGEIAAYVCIEQGTHRILGYTTGHDVIDHWVAVDEHAMLSLYYHSSNRMDELGLCTTVLVIAGRYPDLLRQILKLGGKAQRHWSLMAYGDYQSPTKHLYFPSMGW